MHVIEIPEVQGYKNDIPEVQGYKNILIDRKGRSWNLKEHNFEFTRFITLLRV